ncbi:MAG: TetR/AcrR family transcriptional regulator [Steroidobacteraceae bacterium]
MQAAARLFAKQGFLGTTTRQIATAAGLRQSAIFHWFPSKEAILEALFSRGWDRSLEYFERVRATRLSAALKFCMCLSYDARTVAAAERYIQLMIVPPELHQPKFRRLLAKRRRLIAYLEEFIRLATLDGDFRNVSPTQAARMVLAIDEVVLDAARSETAPSADVHAAMVVDFAVRALAADQGRVDKILRSFQLQSISSAASLKS